MEIFGDPIDAEVLIGFLAAEAGVGPGGVGLVGPLLALRLDVALRDQGMPVLLGVVASVFSAWHGPRCFVSIGAILVRRVGVSSRVLAWRFVPICLPVAWRSASLHMLLGLHRWRISKQFCSDVVFAYTTLFSIVGVSNTDVVVVVTFVIAVVDPAVSSHGTEEAGVREPASLSTPARRFWQAEAGVRKQVRGGGEFDLEWLAEWRLGL